MRASLIIFWALAILGALNFSVWQREQTLAHGRTVLLELGPRDPRSIMQGDYMALRYKIATDAPVNDLANKGRLVLKLDERSVGAFARIDRGEPLAANECLLVYRNRGGLRLGAESFFFQEGDAEIYSRARYGELKVDAKGEAILTGLRDEKLAVLGKAPPR